MKLAILAGLAPDRRSGQVLSAGLLPADQAIRTVKDCINEGRPPNPRFPILIAVAIGGSVLREARFNVDPAELAAWNDGTIREATTDDLAGALEEAERKLDAAAAANAELLAANEARKASDADKLAAITTARDKAIARISELEAQLAEAAKKKK